MGEIADGVNALISLGRGDVTGAALFLRFFLSPHQALAGFSSEGGGYGCGYGLGDVLLQLASHGGIALCHQLGRHVAGDGYRWIVALGNEELKGTHLQGLCQPGKGFRRAPPPAAFYVADIAHRQICLFRQLHLAHSP